MLLLHICCAPCSVACIRALREEGTEPVGLWYNPNIHPFLEYRARRDTLREYAGQIGLDLREIDFYGLREFTAAVAAEPERRCGYCYACRMEKTARYAAEHGFDRFSTTLLISPYQDRERILETGARMGERYGVAFVPYDFRPRFREGQEEARALGLYLQKYCGCVYSEEERFSNRRKKELRRMRRAAERGEQDAPGGGAERREGARHAADPAGPE